MRCVVNPVQLTFAHRQPGASDVLPTQADGFNCGIGICVALGIILRDLADNETFATKSLKFEAEEDKETYCLFHQY